MPGEPKPLKPSRYNLFFEMADGTRLAFNASTSALVEIDQATYPLVAGIEILYLSAEGNVYPCTSLLDERFRVGNVRERPIKELWDDPRMAEMASYPREAVSGPCRDCEKFGVCRGGCRGITYAYTGDLNASFPLCLLACTAPAARSLAAPG